jgi:hypothetical protein
LAFGSQIWASELTSRREMEIPQETETRSISTAKGEKHMPIDMMAVVICTYNNLSRKKGLDIFVLGCNIEILQH